jgi:hypothetical protein
MRIVRKLRRDLTNTPAYSHHSVLCLASLYAGIARDLAQHCLP